MPYSDSCREKILSEDYRDFIVSDIRMPFLQDLLKKDYCFQNPGFFYQCAYLPKSIIDPVSLPAQYAGAKSGWDSSDPEPLHSPIKRKTGNDRISGYRNRLRKSGISKSG